MTRNIIFLWNQLINLFLIVLISFLPAQPTASNESEMKRKKKMPQNKTN